MRNVSRQIVFDAAISEKLENVININLLEVVSLKMLCFVTCSCCHEGFGVRGHGRTDGRTDLIKTSEL